MQVSVYEIIAGTCDVRFFTYLCERKSKQRTNIWHMSAKVQIKDEKYMPYGGIYFVIREFLRLMAPIIDGYLGLRSTLIGYQYSEISLAMLCRLPKQELLLRRR